MTVIFHVFCALSSLLLSSYTYISPTRPKIHASYALVAATLTSGTYLVISTKGNMLKACLTGLIYLAVVLTAIIAAHSKLAAATAGPKKLTD
jgi:multisubunit Na+/H+ antiporter MnhE subunit